MAWPVIAGAVLSAGGLLGALGQKRPRYNTAAMQEVEALINKQYANVQKYFEQANTAFEGQFNTYYGNTMQDAVSKLASSGIFESPISEKQLARQRTALAESYAAGKSELAGQKLTAESSIDQQRINYLQNLANVQYQNALAKQQQKSQIYGIMGGVGSAMLGV